jgi:hypothetical protein
MILLAACNEPWAGARGKLSTVSVDNLAEKISSARNFRCFRPDSVICLFFRQDSKYLILNDIIFTLWQTLEKSGLFVTKG